jgi:hypothetical protein
MCFVSPPPISMSAYLSRFFLTFAAGEAWLSINAALYQDHQGFYVQRIILFAEGSATISES